MGVEILRILKEYLQTGVMPREGHGSRNEKDALNGKSGKASCPARGMGVEIGHRCSQAFPGYVMPREGHGSRNRHHHYT